MINTKVVARVFQRGGTSMLELHKLAALAETTEDRRLYERLAEAVTGHLKVIVESSDVLYACPSAPEMTWRGGTWWTIGHAREKGVPVVVIGPDGRVI